MRGRCVTAEIIKIIIKTILAQEIGHEILVHQFSKYRKKCTSGNSYNLQCTNRKTKRRL